MTTDPEMDLDTGSGDSKEITALLQRWSEGETEALHQLIPGIYRDLRRLAKRHLAGENPQTLNPTALINEIYLELVKQEHFHFENRKRFLAFAGVMMRHILIKHARGRRRRKRGAGTPRITLNEELYQGGGANLDFEKLLALDRAMTGLEAVDPRLCRIVELRFFSGFTNVEIAEAMGLSERTVRREWDVAKCWLRRELRH